MDYSIGQKLKELREYYQIHQGELADGICTQGTISRIEKDETIPNALILHQLAQRLGVTLNYFFEAGTLLNIEYVQQVCDDLTKLVRELKFEEVLNIVKMEKKNPIFRSKELNQILLWREGLCEYYLFKNTERAFELLNEALLTTPTTKKNKSTIEIDILNSIAALHGLQGDYEKAGEIYQEIASLIKKYPINIDSKLEVRIAYNTAVNAYYAGNHKEGIKYADKAIKLCLDNFIFYFLGESYYQKGECLAELNQKEEAIHFMKKSIATFEFQSNQEAINYVTSELARVEALLAKETKST